MRRARAIRREARRELLGQRRADVAAALRDLGWQADIRAWLAAQAERLDGKKVKVTGEYKPRPGVEVRERRIIIVKSLRAAQ